MNCFSLEYTFVNYFTGVTATGYLTTYLQNLQVPPPVYTTYPDLVRQVFCTNAQKGTGLNTCIAITCVGTFCYDNSTKFYCDNNLYLNMATLTCVATCPANFTRRPESLAAKAYCDFDCSNERTTNPCPATTLTHAQFINTATFGCEVGYTRIFYRCLPDSYLPKTALYFNSFFSFPEMIMNTNNLALPTNYFIEFSFLIDNINKTEFLLEQTYFLAPPHRIFKDPADNKFKYANYEIGGGATYFLLASVNDFEWNHFLIEVTEDTTFSTWTIKLYLNYNFTTPEVTINNVSSVTFDMALTGVAFCDNQSSGRGLCTVGGTNYTINWGAAYYDEILIWDEIIANPLQIQSFTRVYQDLPQSLLARWILKPENITGATLAEELFANPLDSFNINWWFNNRDLSYIQNYGYLFDYIDNNTTGTFIQSFSGVSPITSFCDNKCARCTGTTNGSCYECKTNNTLIQGSCFQSLDYLLKTPINNDTTVYVPLVNNSSGADPFNIPLQNPISFTLYMKFFGIRQGVPVQPYYPLFHFYRNGLNENYLAYDPTLNRLVLFLEGVLAFATTSMDGILGEFIFIGISIRRSTDPTRFPHMFNFQINRTIFLPLIAFNVETTPVNINQISFDNFGIVIYSTLSLYSNFIEGPYGRSHASANEKALNRLFTFTLAGSSTNDCIKNSEFDATYLGITIGEITCKNVFNPFINENNQCSNDQKYLDLSLTSISPPCESNFLNRM